MMRVNLSPGERSHGSFRIQFSEERGDSSGQLPERIRSEFPMIRANSETNR